MSGGDLPQRFGNYVLERFLAAGGMAEVFVASRPDGAVPGPIALKRMLPQMMENPEYAAMFRDEASLARRLVHPNIVRLWEAGEYDGRLFMAMELVDGLDAASLVKKLRARNEVLGVGHALRIGVDLCAGLQAAHTLRDDRGVAMMIIHRDVSPQNILISRAGEVKVTDFGVAKATGRETHTATGSIKGKIPYMAPEQALAQHIDQRVDQFAAGIVVWELLTGQRLFADKNDLLMFEKIIRRPTPKPSSVRPGLPPGLDAAVLRALAKNPDERYPDVGAFGDALRVILERHFGWEQSDLAPVVAYVSPPPAGGDTEVVRPALSANVGAGRDSRSGSSPSSVSASQSGSQPSRPTGIPMPAADANLPLTTPLAASAHGGSMAMGGGQAPLGNMVSGIGSTANAAPLTIDRSRARPPAGVEVAQPMTSSRPGPATIGTGSAPVTMVGGSSSSSSSSSSSLPVVPMALALVVGGAAGFFGGRATAPATDAAATAGATGCARPSQNTTDVEAAYDLLLQAQMQLDAGDAGAAAARANEAQVRSGTAKGHYLLGRLRLQSGDVAAGLTHYRCVLEMAPGSDEAARVMKALKATAK